MSLPRHIDFFTSFATKHFSGEAENDYHIRLKLDHSLRVLDDARAIISAENITGHVAELTTLSALYHDIGRFPQFAQYGTFKDVDSINHGRMGVLALRSQELPGGFSKEDWKLIRASIGLHNAKEINPRTNDPLRTMVNVTRDADKLDIFSIILAHLGQKNGPNTVVIHSLEEHPAKYSRTIYETTLAGATCDYGALRYSNDFILLLISWVFSLNYITSIRLLSCRGLIEHAFSLLPKNDEIQTLEKKVHIFIHYKNL
ncbi:MULTISPECIES: HD domain-containing protein [unclassified Pseudodesulfovibrio]|uniref:HD domain-containing protein n=1 Tax=unclassified Pseudodesulfovibrio TaxID=2661612 RepID=UPI000FEBB5D2|nr:MULTISPECIES: HD domain-containing protein [unclassified Pseudodesulfovibrio]MCJ2164048.1 HD domain-containing protein [Pseudodesulfovibrio sp. S3-i]RWU05317.1 HD domain-containing protein [Pseudodesulfovibrio sp. S3]